MPLCLPGWCGQKERNTVVFSITWAIQYWYLCLFALLIGVATGWWIWARYQASASTDARPAAAPVPSAALEPAAAMPLAGSGPRIRAAVGDPDDLELIKGVGPKLNALLISLGVRRFDQIADWTRAEIDEVDAHLGSFKGRIDRDSWVEQAGLLARGDIAAFEARFGELGSEKS